MTIGTRAMEELQLTIRKETNLSFAEFMRAHRLGEGLSQVEFAKILEISRRRLRDIENDSAELSVADAKSIARILDVPAKWLVRLALRDQLKREGIDLRLS